MIDDSGSEMVVHCLVQLYVVLVLTLPGHSQALGEGRSSEDTGAEEESGQGAAAPVSSNLLLGSVIKLGGGILGIAGKLGRVFTTR